MFVGKRHLDDRALIRRYLADRGLEALEARDEALLRHLVQCPDCEARYVALQAAFDESRGAAIAGADEACSAGRLATQRDRILHRIDAQFEGARVLAFPASGTSHATTKPSPLVRRWVAAAAVAGLVVGLTAGRFLPFGGHDESATARRPVSAAGPATPRSTPVLRAVNTNRPQPVDEDEFLSEVDMATAAPQAAELRAIYAFTLEASRDGSPRPGAR